MDDILQRIVAVKHEEIAAARRQRSLASLRDELAKTRGLRAVRMATDEVFEASPYGAASSR